jgi:chemotaxis protein CheZ
LRLPGHVLQPDSERNETMDQLNLHDTQRTANVEPSSASAESEVLARVGQLTRSLHESLRELGYNKLLEEAASAIPDTKDRLAYIASMTEQAANRSLTAAEIAKPLQDGLSRDAEALAQRWGRNAPVNDPSVMADDQGLVADTRRYLDQVSESTAATNAQLLEIMMAQDFQDLTGQLIKKITNVVHTLERDLLQVLLDHAPAERKNELPNTLADGPIVRAEGRTDVVTDQQQVDDLLATLGF